MFQCVCTITKRTKLCRFLKIPSETGDKYGKENVIAIWAVIITIKENTFTVFENFV